MTSGSRRVYLAVAVVLAAGAAVLHAQSAQKRLTLDDIYDPSTQVNFSGAVPQTEWFDDDTYLMRRRGTPWRKVNVATGESSPLADVERMENALAALPGVTRGEAGAAARGALEFNGAHSAVLVTIASDLFHYDIASGRATRLTNQPGEEELADFSPNGQLVAFVRANNLYAVDVTGARERALTTDGNTDTFNGKLDWLYQEEIYGRGNFKGFWWSPDSSRVAFLQLDERPVPEYTVTDHIPYRPALEVTAYPKVGDPNPGVRLGVVAADGGAVTWTDANSYAGAEILIVEVSWTPDSRHVEHQVQNREQTWLDMNLAEATSGRTRTLLRETTKAWVNNLGAPVWLKDGSFLWLSERTGFKHVYRYRDGGSGQATLVGAVTAGRWDVKQFHGIDESKGLVYFSSPEPSALDLQVYRIGLDGSNRTRLSKTPGTHRATFNAARTRYIDRWTDVTTPAQLRLHGADGNEIRTIDANPVTTLAEYRLSKPEFLQVKTRDGGSMDALMIKPPDFDARRRYPVYQFTYSGPGSSQVLNSWKGQDFMFYQLLAQSGVVVWVLDNRSASQRGVEAQWPVYGRLGEYELQDLEDGITWLKQQPYIDASRIVLSGWSYGGFMTAYALTHSTSWSAGVVGAPVSDLRDYDSVYTERYMKLLKNNPDGYRRTAPRFAADRLHGRMLLIHGTMDDNVHMQNSVQFAYELQRAGKQFEMMMYAKQRHGFSDPLLIKHLHQLEYDFVMRAVALPPAPATK
ncbi:MAG TPA: S9 family peptidase [Vicinamibacterales bacterium]|nr:S9 family peptidase [Vicinamibacterales bacterium]